MSQEDNVDICAARSIFLSYNLHVRLVFFQLFDYMVHFVSQSLSYMNVCFIKVEVTENKPVPNFCIIKVPLGDRNHRSSFRSDYSVKTNEPRGTAKTVLGKVAGLLFAANLPRRGGA